MRSMRAFLTRYPRQAAQETRTIMIPQGEPVPAGTYGYLEFFCPDTECDCRRVVLSVMSRETGGVMATLSYGWETAEFYRNWSHGEQRGVDMVGVSLDPLAPQTEYAGYFLGAFRDMVSVDRAYRDRIQRHYEMFKRPGKHGGAYQGDEADKAR